jgi:histone methylation protein DOT1
VDLLFRTLSPIPLREEIAGYGGQWKEMDLDRMRSELADLCSDRSLLREDNLAARARALDFAVFVQRIVRTSGTGQGGAALGQRAAMLERYLEKIDRRLFDRLRSEIRMGGYAPATLRQIFDQYTDYSPQTVGEAHIGYDGLDVLVNGLLLADRVPGETFERTSEMVQYEATPAAAILDLIDHSGLGPGDVLYDLGAGLGHVVMLVNLLAGIRTTGIEIDPAFCAYARRASEALGLSDVRFVNVDARDAEYADGTVFFMFTPFTGGLLEAVLDRLRCEAAKRMIRVCTYGSCTLRVAHQRWLRSLDANADHEFKLAVFSSV